ncbi:MAG: hypothetical protein NZ583_03585 [Desulfobacterota bacterium]|nr:hypothetical protein [Thermodesulfobacteriota bacterium]
MRKSLKVMLIAILFIFGSLSHTYAQGFIGCLKEKRDIPILADLSKEKLERLKEIRERFRKEAELLREEIIKTKMELRRLYFDPQAKEEEIRAKHKELASLLERLREKILERKLEERKLFSPSELEKMRDCRFGRFFRCG